MNRDTLCEEMGRHRGKPISNHSLIKYRKELEDKGYIQVAYIDTETNEELPPEDDILSARPWNYYIKVINRWDENRAIYDADFRQR